VATAFSSTRPTTGSPELRLAPTRSRRSPTLAVGSVALVIVSIAVFTAVYVKAGNKEAVLAVSRVVPMGQIVTAADLTVVKVSASAVSTVSAGQASAVIGQRAAESLLPGTLLSAGELERSFSPPRCQAVVGVAVKEGQLPAAGVVAGETVDVILTGLTPTPDSTATDGSAATDGAPTSANGSLGVAGATLVPGASVLASVPASASSGTDEIDVSLVVPAAVAPLVAGASAAGQVALVVVRPGS